MIAIYIYIIYIYIHLYNQKKSKNSFFYLTLQFWSVFCVKSRELHGLNLSRSQQQGHSATYNTLFRVYLSRMQRICLVLEQSQLCGRLLLFVQQIQDFAKLCDYKYKRRQVICCMVSGHPFQGTTYVHCIMVRSLL